MTRLSFLPEPFIRIALGKRSDLGGYVIAGIHNEVARVWRVNPDDTDGGELKFTGGAGKDDSLDVAIENDGSVFLVISEASGAQAGGATSEPTTYRFPSVFPPYAGVSASGGYVSAPGGGIRIFDGTAGFSGQETVLLAPYNIPPDVTLNVEVRLRSPIVGMVGRVGPDDPGVASFDAGPMLNVFTQASNVFVFSSRAVRARPDNTLAVIADYGKVEILVSVLGWWY